MKLIIRKSLRGTSFVKPYGQDKYRAHKKQKNL
jgi:hypothetical protein